MGATKLKRYKRGEKLDHADYNLVVAFAERFANLRVDEGCGLTIHQSDAGPILSLVATHQGKYVRITEAIPPADDETHPGHGMGMILRCKYAPNNDCVLEDTKITEVIYSFADGEIAEDTIVQVKRIDGRLHVDTELCSGGG